MLKQPALIPGLYTHLRLSRATTCARAIHRSLVTRARHRQLTILFKMPFLPLRPRLRMTDRTHDYTRPEHPSLRSLLSCFEVHAPASSSVAKPVNRCASYGNLLDPIRVCRRCLVTCISV